MAYLVIGVRPLIRHALRRATFPVGEGDLRRGLSYPLLGEGGRAIGPDGCGAGRRTDLVPPLFRRCGGTFPQGKVRERLHRRESPALSCLERVPPAGGGCGGDTEKSRTGPDECSPAGRQPPPEVAFPYGEGGPGAARDG